jgi:hypothetical protein
MGKYLFSFIVLLIVGLYLINFAKTLAYAHLHFINVKSRFSLAITL